MYIVNDYLGTYGGSTTLLLRMAEWIKQQHEDLKIYTYDASNKEIVSKLSDYGVCTELFNTKKISELRSHLKDDVDNKDCVIINFMFNSFLDVETVKRETKRDFKNVLYAIHPETFLKGQGYSNRFVKKAIKAKYINLIQKLNKQHVLISMDQDIIDKTEQYYGVNLNEPMHKQLLPMICKEIAEESLKNKIKESYDSKMIVSAFRAEFPFKGYVMGLIDDFEKLQKKFPNIKLVLVSSGEKEDVERLIKKISSKSKECQSQITLHKWMKYEQLKNLVYGSYMVVGMGTAVVDAAVSYVPSIAVKYNTYENNASSLFYEKPELLVAYSGKAIDQMERLLSMDYTEYYDTSIASFTAVKKYYDINAFFDYIDSLKKQKSCLSFFDSIVYRVNSFVNSHKKIENFGVDQIERED